MKMLTGTLVILCVAVCGVTASPEKTHTGSITTKHFDVLYRPNSRAGASAERTAAMAERELENICTALKIDNDGRYKLYLYDGVGELLAITKTQGNSGFSSDDAMHIPFDNDQTRFHEMVHVVAHRMPKTGKEPRNMFFVEGLANALLEYVHGNNVHAIAKFAKKNKRLPKLNEMTSQPDFYQWMRGRPKLNAYDVAAS